MERGLRLSWGWSWEWNEEKKWKSGIFYTQLFSSDVYAKCILVIVTKARVLPSSSTRELERVVDVTGSELNP